MKTNKKGTTKLKIIGLKKADLGEYLELNGAHYERINSNLSTISLDLDLHKDKKIQAAVQAGGFVNEQEFIRHAVREGLKKDVSL